MLQTLASTAAGQAKGYASKEAGTVAKSKFFKYLLVSFLLGVLCSTVGFLERFSSLSPQAIQLILIATLVLFGILHLVQMNRRFSWAARNILQAEIFFTLMVSAIGCIGFSLAFYLLGKYLPDYFMNSDYLALMATAFIILSVPWLLKRAFHTAISIPPEQYKAWTYPAKSLVFDTENIDLTNIAIVTFIFSKKFGEQNNSNFQIKAPYQMKFGDLFYFFIQEWNHKFPGKEIQYLDDENKSFGWYYFVKEKWWQSKKFLDPDFTILQNQIKVNQIIQTQRVLLNK